MIGRLVNYAVGYLRDSYVDLSCLRCGWTYAHEDSEWPNLLQLVAIALEHENQAH